MSIAESPLNQNMNKAHTVQLSKWCTGLQYKYLKNIIIILQFLLKVTENDTHFFVVSNKETVTDSLIAC